MMPEDVRQVFLYLTDSDGTDQSTLMSLDQFLRLHSEAKERNIDPFEIVVFQEEQSLNLQDFEKVMRLQKEMKEID